VRREGSRDRVQVLPVGSDIIRMERSTSGYEKPMRREDDDDGLRSEVGQTLALFGMSLAVVLVGLLVGLGL
jgi:hypothetical protein